jgi:hypothetical protein
MAIVNKNFKIKNGLVVEGTTGTINGYNILTESQDSIDFIVSTIGGTATSENTANTVVKRDANGDFAAGDITVNELSISEIGRIYEDEDGDLVIANIDDKDVEINASDLRLNATDDIRLEADDFIGITSLSGIIEFSAAGGNVFINGDAPEDKIVVRGTLNDIVGDGTVDGTTGNTITDRIASASQDLTDHENATEAHGATGAVVGTTNEQTLTNKTISYTDNTLTVQVANVSDLTATASELNVLDGITATTTELNYVDGVTSGIQGQLDDKAPLASPSLTGTPLAPTATPGTNNTQIATTAYADAAVAAIVDGAPDLLNTLNELAAAINDDENFASTLTTLAGEKVAKSGDTMTGLLVLSADPSAELGAATKQYVDQAEADAVTSANAYTDGRETAITTAYEAYADQAEVDAKAYTDTREGAITTAYEAYADQAEVDAKAYADSLTTDDVAEGTVQYFTDARAKSSAASLLTGATLTNITITGTGSGLTITAENGVADSTTTDLAEGTNLYFTDARARTAVDGTDRSFTSVELNSVAKQVAATLEAETAGIQVAHSFAKADYRSAEYLVKVAYSTHTEISKVLLTLDASDNIAITEYGIVGTNGSASSVSAAISGTNVQLLVDTENNDSTVTVVGTLLA